MRKKKEQILIETCTIIDLGSDGRGVSKVNDKIIFVDKSLPGDVVSALVYKSKKNYGEAKITEILKPSDIRITPQCQHFGTCGGCKLQNINYEQQLFYKEGWVRTNLEKLAKVSTENLKPILGSSNSFHYRNRLDFTFSNKRWLTKDEIATNIPQSNALGFHVAGCFDKVLPISSCSLMDERANEIRNAIYHYAIGKDLTFYDIKNHHGFLRNLIIRNTTTDEWMVILVVAENNDLQIQDLLHFIKSNFPFITSLQYIINQKKNDTIFDQDVQLYEGRDHIIEVMDGLHFKISAKSFYQTNPKQAQTLYACALQMASLKGDELVYDLYTGTGTIAQYFARHCKHVIGIEYIEDAIRDAQYNAVNNNLQNTTFIAGDLAATFTKEFVARHGKPQVIITDPPRAGMHPDVVSQINQLRAEKVIYISCNPATQARDLILLQEVYSVEAIQPVDMFPQTTHVENIVLLKRKD